MSSSLQERILRWRYRRHDQTVAAEIEEASLDLYRSGYQKAFYTLNQERQAHEAVMQSIRMSSGLAGLIQRWKNAVYRRKAEVKRAPHRWGSATGERPAMRSPAHLYPPEIWAEIHLFEALLPFERAMRQEGKATLIDGSISFVKFVFNETLRHGAFDAVVGICGAVFSYRAIGCNGQGAPPLSRQILPIWAQIQERVSLIQTREVRQPGNEPFEQSLLSLVGRLKEEFGSFIFPDPDLGIRRKQGSAAERSQIKRSLRKFVPGALPCDYVTRVEDEVQIEIHKELQRAHIPACISCLSGVAADANAILPEEALEVIDMQLISPEDPDGDGEKREPPQISQSQMDRVRVEIREINDVKGTSRPSHLVVKVDGVESADASKSLNKTGQARVQASPGARTVEVWAPNVGGDKQVLLASFPVVFFPTELRFDLPAGQVVEFSATISSLDSSRTGVEITISYKENDFFRQMMLITSRVATRFEQSPTGKETKRPLGWGKPSRWATALLLIAVGVGILYGIGIIDFSKKVTTEGQKSNSQIEPPTAMNSQPYDQLRPNKNAASENNPVRRVPTVAPKVSNLNAGGISLLAAEMNRGISRAAASGVLPKIQALEDLGRTSERPLGEKKDGDRIEIKSPDGYSVRRRRVRLNWRPPGKYQVFIYDAAARTEKPIHTARVEGTSYVTPPLPRGKEYAWQVRGYRDGRLLSMFDEPKFRVLSKSDLETLKFLAKRYEKQPLQLGVTYAFFGLVPEARRVLGKAEANPTTAERGKRLLQNLNQQYGFAKGQEGGPQQ